MSDPICNERGIPQSDCPWYCTHGDSGTELHRYVLEMARKADAAERRADEAEFHVEQLRDARDRAERRVDRAGRLLEGWEHGGPYGLYDPALRLVMQQVREALDVEGVGTGAGEGATGQDTGTAWVTRSADCPEAPAQAHPLDSELLAAIASVTPCSCNAQRARAEAAEAEVHNLSADLDRCEERLWRLAAIAGWRPGNPADNNATAELWIADALAGESRCEHEWLDRPESDTRECLICGTEVSG